MLRDQLYINFVQSLRDGAKQTIRQMTDLELAESYHSYLLAAKQWENHEPQTERAKVIAQAMHEEALLMVDFTQAEIARRHGEKVWNGFVKRVRDRFADQLENPFEQAEELPTEHVFKFVKITPNAQHSPFILRCDVKERFTGAPMVFRMTDQIKQWGNIYGFPLYLRCTFKRDSKGAIIRSSVKAIDCVFDAEGFNG